ncbi:hypothetical protein D3C81_1008120 [compost metagenome]
MGQAHAATEDKTIEQCQHWLGVAMQVLVQGVLLLEEQLMQVVAGLVAVVQHADIATGAEGLFTGAANGHGDDLRVLFPSPQVPA